jgi:uncharacterized membrane protein
MEKTVFIDQKKIGLVIIALSVILFILTFYLTDTIMKLKVELHKTCPLPPEECPYKSSVPVEAVASFILVAGIGIFGLLLTLTARGMEKIAIQEKRKLKDSLKGLAEEERRVYGIISSSDGLVFQSDLIEKTNFSKVKISRILDRLEAKNLVERRRRGMANIIVLKE